MPKHRSDPLLEALREGRSYTWTVPDGGNLASMRKAIKHGQSLTMSPITDTKEIQAGDLVLVKWHQTDIFHIVGEIQGDQFLIVNSLGKINGWVDGKEILGKITNVIEPAPRPDVPTLLKQLEEAYLNVINQQDLGLVDGQRLLFIVDDLQWYSYRIGKERWDVMPRDNIWSFHQNLWRLTKQARHASEQEETNVDRLVDHGKKCIGMASEIILLFEEK